MYSREQLLEQIEAMKVDPKGTLLIHSSMKSIGEVEGGPETVLDVWIQYMKDGLLIFPTYTWDKIGADAPVYDSRTEPSCVGLLTNLFLRRPDVVRSLHPTHSVAALGRDAKDYVQGEEQRDTPCPRNGCWGKLIDRNATILFLGCTMNSNTFLHGVEEWNHIPNRLTESTQALTIIDREGQKHEIAMHRHNSHCPDGLDVSEHYGKLEKPFAHLGAIRYGSFGDAKCILGNGAKMAEITSVFLQKDPQLFLSNAPIPSDWY